MAQPRKQRPLARIKRGQSFSGNKVSAIAEGVVVYGEYDAADRRSYYWEEWELRGLNDYDSWIEYDHYTRTVKLYEPYKVRDHINAKNLVVGQSVSFTGRWQQVPETFTVNEVGVGTAVRRDGTLTYHVFPGDTVAYAEGVGAKGTYCLETYNDKEFDIYKVTLLNRVAQKKLLGRVVEPRLSKTFSASTWLYIIIIIATLLFSMVQGIRDNKSDCSPRSSGWLPGLLSQPASVIDQFAISTTQTTPTTTTTTPSTTQPSSTTSTSQTSQQQNTCSSNRGVYGGGSGGYGK